MRIFIGERERERESIEPLCKVNFSKALRVALAGTLALSLSPFAILGGADSALAETISNAQNSTYYTVTYIVDGNVYATQQVLKGETPAYMFDNRPATPTKDGYHFYRWCVDEACSKIAKKDDTTGEYYG